MAQRRAFVGRDRELEDIAGAFDDAAAGRGTLFLLVGGAGIGKTRLADELARKAEAHGLQPIWGRCWETGGAPAYWPWIQVLRELVQDRPAAELRAAAGPGVVALAQLVPELGAAEGGGAADPDPSQARFRLFDAVTGLLKQAARTRPLFIVLDDLHTADPSSLALLHFLARNLRGLRALVVGTYRDEEARLEPELGVLLGDVAREATYLPLAPLSRAEMAELVTRFSGRPADAVLLESLQRATEGNPLFLDELLRLLLQRGELDSRRGRSSLPGPTPSSSEVESTGASGSAALPVPDTVREVIRRRVARLPAETRELLGLASIVGREVGLSTLAVLAGTPATAVATGLGPAEAANLLVPSDATTYRFSHVLVREALYRDLPAARRGELHLQVAALLETRGAGALAEVAHHRLAALPSGDPAEAAAAARRAADRAAAMLAFEDAAALLEQARAALEGAGCLDPRDGFELRLMAGLAFMRAGQGDHGRALCNAAAAEARRMGDGARIAEAALGYGAELMLAQNDPVLIGLLEESLGALPAGPSGTRAQVMARLAAARMPTDDVGPPMAMAREAVAMARACGAESAVLRKVLFFAGSALADYGEPAERAAVSEEMIALARAAGDKVQMLRGECRLVFDYLELGEVAKSQIAAVAYEAVAREFNQPRHLWPARLMRGMYATAEGRLAEARRSVEEARALAASDRDPVTASVLAWHEISQALIFERADAIDQSLVDLEGSLHIPGFERIAQGMLAIGRVILMARFGEDRVLLQRELNLLPWDVGFLTVDHCVVACLVEAVAVCRDATRAAQLYANLAPHAARIGSWGRSGFACLGPFEIQIGLLAGTMGRHDEAMERLEKGAAVSDRLGFAIFAAHARQWQAHFLSQRRGPGDVERAATFLDQAEGAAKANSLERLAARIAATRAALALEGAAPPAQPPPRPARVEERFTLAREGDYWSVAAAAGIVRIRDARGMQMLAELISHPGRELHVLALMGANGEADGGDAGEVIDQEAIADYRERLRALEDELSEAESWADTGRAARARAERDALAQELARGVGLGGRGRRAGAAAERARVNVQRRIRGTIRKIGESLPDLGTYLDRAVRTGTFCSYEPF